MKFVSGFFAGDIGKQERHEKSTFGISFPLCLHDSSRKCFSGIPIALLMEQKTENSHMIYMYICIYMFDVLRFQSL